MSIRAACAAAVAALAALAVSASAHADTRDPINAYSVDLKTAVEEPLAQSGFDLTEGRRDDGSIQIFGTAGQMAKLKADEGISARVVEDRQGRTTAERSAQQVQGPGADDSSFTVWRRYDRVAGDTKQQYLEIYDDLVARFPGIVKREVVGRTRQGRDIVALKVTKDANATPDGSRPAVLNSALQHAREWLAGETCLRTLKYYTSGYGGSDPTITNLVNTRELWFVCVANPDGYEYTFTEGNRLWRKNMADNDGDGKFGEVGDGVDPNRNFPTNWGRDDEGSSSDPTSETFRGTGPASEPETQAMVGLMKRVKFAFNKNDHTAAELILYPQGFQQYTPTADDAIFTALAGDDRNSAIADRNAAGEITGHRFDPDLGAELYITNGDTTDFAYRETNILAYTPEGTDPRIPGRSVFEFPDDEAQIEAEFQRHRRFALDLAKSAADPANPMSHLGNTVKDFYVDEFADSYGDPQPVQATVKRSLGPVKLRYRINDGRVHTAATHEWEGGEHYYRDDAVYYHRVRGKVSGTDRGDSVEVWFENAGGSKASKHFTYTARVESDSPVLILSAENYSGPSPAQDPSGPRYLSFFTDALDANGVGYEVYDVDRRGNRAPHPLGVLSHFKAVVWYTGDDSLTRLPGQTPGTGTARLALDEEIAVRDYLNEGGKLFYTGKNAGQQYASGAEVRNFGFPEPPAPGGEFCNKNGTQLDPATPEFDRDDPSKADGCIQHNNDFLQYYLGAYVYVDGGNSADPETGKLFPLAGQGPFAPLTWGFDDATGAGNQNHSATFAVTSSILDPARFPLYADSRSLAGWVRPGAAPYAPHTGQYYLAANAHDGTYKRVRRTIDLTGATAGELSFRASYDLEADYDYMFVEAHTVGGDDWTTLPDANGHTTDATGLSCPSQSPNSNWQSLHPWLARYQTVTGPTMCTPAGTTGQWNAATGNSGGWQDWKIDLSRYAGKKVEVSVSVATDPGTVGLGLWLDDTKVTAGGQTVAETSFEADLGGWQVGPPPEGTRNLENGWQRTLQQFTEGGVVGTDDTVYTGFGFEGIGGADTRAAFIGRVLEYLGVQRGGPGEPGASPPASAPVTPPAAAKPKRAMPVRLSVGRLRADRRGRVKVRVRCPAEAQSACRGTLRLTGGKRTLGRKQFSVRAGQTATVTVKLSRSALRTLQRKRRQRISLSVSGVDGGGASIATRRNVTLLAPKAKRRAR